MNIEKFLCEQMEDRSLSTAMLEFVEKKQGARIINRLPDGWKIIRRYGITYLCSEGKEYVLSYEGAFWPTPEVFQKLNPCYYEGADERNAYRQSLLLDHQRMSQIELVTIQFEKAKEAYEKAKSEINALIKHPFPDQYELERLIGIKE